MQQAQVYIKQRTVRLVAPNEWPSCTIQSGVRTKENFTELFQGEPNTLPGSNKRIFPRLPLHNIMHAFSPSGAFDFHLAGVHLKAYMGNDDPGTDQRRLSAERLVQWSNQETEDRDIIVCGDFNKAPSAKEWKVFRDEEKKGHIRFTTWNKEEEGSHWYNGKTSRIDLVIVSDSVSQIAVTQESKVIPWKGVFDSSTLREDLISRISDHMPVVSRFYFRDLDAEDVF